VIPLSIILWNTIEHPAMRRRRGIVAGLKAMGLRLAQRKPAGGVSAATTSGDGSAAEATPLQAASAPLPVRAPLSYGRPIGAGFRQ
jgi:peptidoglycan/LPS O-acetylase OafA/YrhL